MQNRNERSDRSNRVIIIVKKKEKTPKHLSGYQFSKSKPAFFYQNLTPSDREVRGEDPQQKCCLWEQHSNAMLQWPSTSLRTVYQNSLPLYFSTSLSAIYSQVLSTLSDEP